MRGVRPSGRPQNPSKSPAKGVPCFRPRRYLRHHAPWAVAGAVPCRSRGRSYGPAEGRRHGITHGAGRPASAAHGRGLVVFWHNLGTEFYGNSHIFRLAKYIPNPTRNGRNRTRTRLKSIET